MSLLGKKQTDEDFERVYADIETDSLTPTLVHCVVVECVDSGKVATFDPDNLASFVVFAKRIKKWVGHNFLCYDAPALNRLLGTEIAVGDIVDTLVLSRLANPVRHKGHSLENWGRFFPDHPKIDFHDYSKYTPEMMTYCIRDVELVRLVYQRLLKELNGFSYKSIQLEHQVAWILHKQREHGFYLNIDKARKIYAEIKEKADFLEEGFEKDFPPERKEVNRFRPKFTKEGEMYKKQKEAIDTHEHDFIDGEYILYGYFPFNAGSPKQVVERMNEAGWKPTQFTPTGQPKQCEENFDTLPDTAPKGAKNFTEWRMLSNRLGVLQGWFEAYNPQTHSVHGTCIHIGAGTHRMAHRNPQMGNITATRKKYGKELRSCWTVGDTEKYCVVGTDIEGVQLRILAHLANSTTYTKAIVEGNTDDKTDIHNINASIISEVHPINRDDAKTFIYAMLLGAGNKKLAAIMGVRQAKLGGRAKDLLIQRIDGLASVYNMCKRAAKVGYMVAIDGRRIAIPSEHQALSCYLQGNEAIIMKQALVYTNQRARHLDWAQMAVVHDEIQSKCLREHAEELAAIQCRAIVDAGELFKLNCPLAAKAQVGDTWYDTH